MKIALPELSLVVLIGPSGAGKSTFARTHFKPTEVLSSDTCRGLVADNENDQTVSREAFDVLHYIAAKRLAGGRLTVVDATNVRPEDREPLVRLAREQHCLPIAIIFNLPEELCHARNAARPDRDFGPHVVRGQRGALRRGLRGLRREGFRHVFIFDSPEDVAAAEIERVPLWNNRKHEHGPFDIIGDVHGCYDELVELLTRLGYAPSGAGEAWTHAAGRRLIFLGDLVDRGPKVPEVVRLAIDSVRAGSALCVPGNHDVKFMRAVRGKNVQIAHGLAESLAQFKAYDERHEAFSRVAADFIDSLVSHYVLDDGKLVVAHAGMKAEMQGRGSGKVREFALFGETTGETDEFGLPVRCNWAAEYRGSAIVAYGHTPTPEPEWLNRTINIDTGCVFGGKLTALRYPELELVSTPAQRVYAESKKPFPPAEALAATTRVSAQHAHDDVLDIADLLGKRIISARLHGNIILSAAQTAAALEVMSRFAADPKWLIYLPPTMSPCETSLEPDLLEHPREAFAYYRHQGQPRVVCEEKHMGSRAVAIVCRDAGVSRRRFGVVDGGTGVVYTRTGRRFFDDRTVESQVLERLRIALCAAGFWDELQTDWVCLDCELMPWSAKALGLLREQYAAVGAAARAGLAEVGAAIEQRGADELSALRGRIRERAALTDQYVLAYRRYCWAVDSVADLKLAPFHVLATEGRVHVDRDHAWHMDTLARVCAADPEILLATEHRTVDLTDAADEERAVAWWTALTGRGGEGMVVKPFHFVARGPRGLVQPAVKCRGREYLRIIYGPEYTLPEHLERLRRRGLNRKRGLALREFALGVEALERFVRREPLRRVHECVLAVLALESEPVDPRL